MIKIHAIRTGFTLVSSAVPDRSSQKSKIAYTGLFQRRSKRIKVPVKCFLVETSDKKILVDTGWGSSSADHPVLSIGFKLWFASEPVLNNEETLPSRFESIGVNPHEIDAVILTHMDVDHVGGLQDVSFAKHIYASQEELDKSKTRDVRYNSRLWKDIDIEPLKMTYDDMAPFKCSCDLYGDGEIKVVFTPGHSAGSVAVVVNGSEQFAAIVGDDGYNKNSWDKLRLPGPVYDKEEMRKSLCWVRDIRANKKCAGIFAAHDPDVAPGDYEVL